MVLSGLILYTVKEYQTDWLFDRMIAIQLWVVQIKCMLCIAYCTLKILLSSPILYIQGSCAIALQCAGLISCPCPCINAGLQEPPYHSLKEPSAVGPVSRGGDGKCCPLCLAVCATSFSQPPTGLHSSRVPSAEPAYFISFLSVFVWLAPMLPLPQQMAVKIIELAKTNW